MSRYSETQIREIIENKPYLTKRELGWLLDKKGKNLDKKITSLLKKEDLILLKKGMYVSRVYSLVNADRIREYLANILYYPSYLSLEYVLQKEGLIPEAVYVYTSITSKLPRIFENKLGTFSYRSIKDVLFTGYEWTVFKDSYKIKMATKAKALFDFLYLKPLFLEAEKPLDDLRINWFEFSRKDFQEFLKYVKISASKKMLMVSELIRRFYVGK